MRVLIVGFPDSVHLVKSVSMLRDMPWDFHLVGATDAPWQEGFDYCTIHHISGLQQISAKFQPLTPSGTRHVVVHPPPSPGTDVWLHRVESIARLIDELRPDIVHSHEFQHGAYITLAARERCVHPFPAWIVTSWGSDLYFHGRDPHHRRAIGEILAAVDGYWSDCSRDIAIARSEGFRGLALPVVPTAGGYNLDEVRQLRSPGPVSSRTAIAVKGYQHQFGRAMVTLDALDMCGDLLRGRELVLHSVTGPDVEEAAQRLAGVHHAQLVVLKDVPNREVIRMYGRARVAIGLSISDGTPSSFLEAMLGGAFPIQSYTACASEWVVDGVGGILVDPTNLTSIARAIRRALTDDKLVDSARAINDSTIDIRLDRDVVRAAMVEGYRRVAAAHASGAASVSSS